MSTELTITLTSNLPQALVLTSQNVSSVSFLVVKLRKRDSLCESVLFLFREQPSSAFSAEAIKF